MHSRSLMNRVVQCNSDKKTCTNKASVTLGQGKAKVTLVSLCVSALKKIRCRDTLTTKTFSQIKKKEAQNKMYSKMRTTITEETDDLACK
jgi:hypothetical protein